MKYNELGQELPDDTPLEIPLGMRRPLTLQEEIQAAVRGAVSRAAARNEMETFEEANDFDIPDDDIEDTVTVHEYRDMKVEVPDEAKRIFEDFRESRKSKPALGAGERKGGEAETASEDAGLAGDKAKAG